MERRSHGYPSNEECLKKVDESFTFLPEDLCWSLYSIRWEENITVLWSISSSLLVITEFSIALI